MTNDIFWVLGYAAAGVALGVILLLLGSLLMGVANRFAAWSAGYPHRVGTHIPRVLN
jgi:hypothetical protein